MDDLFPLKVNIPDEFEQDNSEHLIVSNIVCFIFSTQDKAEEIRIDSLNKIYPLGNIIKNEKTHYIYYIETYSSNPEIKIEISKKPSFFKLEDFEFNSNKNFLFNKFYKQNNFLYELNCFDIYEEFEIYYKIHSSKKNINSLNSLYESAINEIKNVPNKCEFDLFLNIFMKAPLKLIQNNIDNILVNLKNKGDLTRISKNALFKVVNNLKEKRIVLIIFLIYMLLSEQNMEEIEDYLQNNGISIIELICCLDNYKNLFLNSLRLFPNYSSVINNTNSLDKLKVILKCSKNLPDFIYSVDSNKEFISKYMKSDIKNLKLNDFFDLEKEFNQKFEENFYFALNNIREFETKIDAKILVLDNKQLNYENFKNIPKIYIFIKILIFSYLIGQKISSIYLYNILKDLMNLDNELSKYLTNCELIEIIDILFNETSSNENILNNNSIKKNECMGIITLLFKSIKFKNINKELIPFFSKINWDIICEEDKIYSIILIVIVSYIEYIHQFEFILVILEKLFVKEKKINVKKDENKYHRLIIFTLNKLLEKYLLIVDNIIKNDQKEEIIQITSKLIYLKYKYQIKNEFVISLTSKIETDLLNDILISTFDNFDLQEHDLNEIIKVLIQRGKFGKIYNDLLINNKFFSKFENLLNNNIIKDDIEQFIDKNNFNNLLLINLYEKKFFKLYKDSSYAKRTIEQLKKIKNSIIDMKNISFKQIEFLLNSEEQIKIFALIDNEPVDINIIRKRLNEIFDKINSIIKIKDSEDFLAIKKFQKLKFSNTKQIIEDIFIFFEEFKNADFYFNDELKKLIERVYKIRCILKLFKILEKIISTNYFFKIIKEKNINYSLFEQILFIFDDNKVETINVDIIPLFNSFLFLEQDKRKKTIMSLDYCNYLLKIITLNADFDTIFQLKEEICNDTDKINSRMKILIIKDKIKEIINKYLSFKKRIKQDKNNKQENNDNNNSSLLFIISLLSSEGINEEMINNKEINALIEAIIKSKFIKIMNILFKNVEALDFLFSITSQDCRNILELAGEVHGGNNQNFLSIEELLPVEKLVESLEYIDNEIKNNKNKNEDEIIIKNTLNQIEEEDLEKFINKYQQYIEFFNENLNKTKFTAEIIQKILSQSEILILNSNEHYFIAYYKDENGKDEKLYKEFNYDDMIELRDRALTRNKINDSLLDKQDEFTKNLKEEEQIISENNNIYIEIVHKINELIKLLNKISQKGFIYYFENKEIKNNNNINNDNEKDKKDIFSDFKNFEKINDVLLLRIKIKIQKGNESYKILFSLNGEEYNNYEEIKETINKIDENIENIQRNAYLKKKYVNFIHGKQFQLFLNYFLNNKKNQNLNYFLSYFVNKEKVDINIFDYKNKEFNIKTNFIHNFYQNFIEQCEIFLESIIKDNELSLKDIYNQNKIIEKFKELNGIYLNGSSNLENEIIYFYKYLTNNTPLASTLLLCKKDTTSEEIISFLNRAILTPHHILFCLARTDYLSEEKKNIILKTIMDLINRIKTHFKEYKMISCLIITSKNLDDELFKSLFRFKYIKTFDIPEKEKNKIKIIEGNNNNIFLVSSDHSGVGKSTYIKDKTNEKNYIYFPIGGIFTKEDTLKRLQNLDKEKNINNDTNNLLLHIDLYDTDKKSLMNDFLYFVLFTRLYGQDNNIFYLSKKIKIYIEIPYSFINFLDKFPLLKLFPNKKLTLDSLIPLKVPEDICSNVKIVSLYLKLLKEENVLPENTSINFKANNKIDKNDIVFPFTPPDIILQKDKNYDYDYNKIVIKAVDENKYLTPKLCEELILETIHRTIKRPNYYQINTFINVLSSQLIQFNRNFGLSACTFLDSASFNNCAIRSFIIQKFIDLTGYFTNGAFTELLNEQKGVQTLMKSKRSEKEKIEEANKLLEECKHDSISFEKMDLALVFFHGGNNCDFFSIITNKKINDPIYINLLGLRNFQTGQDIIKLIEAKDKTKINLEGVQKLNDYRNYELKDYLEELKSILAIINPIETKSKDNDLKPLKEIMKDYVITEDNFLKMCLILIRIRANIPVIMMGETGCGKTSLIKKLSELKNNGKNLLITDNIHAGHTNEDIIDFIETKVIPEAKKLSQQEENNEIKKLYLKENMVYEEQKVWVFFDELNTCKSMDLLSEIICKHSCQGKKLPENITFFGAVNPYRKSKQKRVGLKININKDNDHEEMDNEDLAYIVNPLPHSLLNYVFDFGALSKKDEKNYIKHMINDIIKENELSDLTKELISLAQNFIREKNDISSVSLREIRRFIVFYKFFIKYINIRKETIIEQKIEEKNNENINYSKLTDYEIKLYSINLSIYLDYYLRLTDINEKNDINNEGGLRKTLCEKLNEIFMKKSKIDFLAIPKREEHFIADNVELEKGIAKNRALLENLFSLFVSINTRVPIFILGKPGCSKSLSIQLISNAMKGKTSNNPFFKKFPKMYVSTYQGALNSNSEGVIDVFKKARKILESKENKEKISTFYFDEMGLAEHSPHNPLKVIHSELEFDNDDVKNKIAFIGISNWRLDAAKMNRGLTINIPDPNEKDIQTTSITIAQSYLGENLENNIKLYFQKLGSCYYDYKQEFKKIKSIQKYEDFHGNRDFYHLIKYPATKIKEAIKNKQNIDEKFLASLSKKALERNFGGLVINDRKYTNGIDLIVKKLSEKNKEIQNSLKNFNYDIKEKIKDNLIELSDDYLSRYLLLITRTNIGIYLLSSFLKSLYKNEKELNNYTILIGSIFLEDIQMEEYTTKILKKIKMNMEKETILILKDFDSIYPSLYDLFNQNFVKVKGKKYARIALGNRTNSFSEVNKNFRCIIIVDQDKIPNQEIPFLNRFEKQNISFKYLMSKEQIDKAKALIEKCRNLITYDEKKIRLVNYNLNDFLINCDEEEILGFVYMETQGKKVINEKEYENIENNFISKLGKLLPQDIILILLLNKRIWESNDKRKKKFYEKLLDYYNKNNHNNIKSFLTNYESETNKIIIYTFNNIIEPINRENLFSYKIKYFGREIEQKNIKQILISSIQNEYDLETEIDKFLDNKNLKMLIIKLLPFESYTIDYLKSIIENKEMQYKNKVQEKINKLFIFIIHLERIDKKDLEGKHAENWDLIKKKILTRTLSNLAGYTQVFIDDLNGRDYLDKENKIISLDKIVKMKNADLYRAFINPRDIILENLNNILFFFDYSFNYDESGLNKDIYINKLLNLFIEDNYLIEKIDEKIIENINNKFDKNNKNDKNKNALEKIIQEEKFSRGDICIIDIIRKILNKNYLNEFKILYTELEKNYYFFSSLIFNKRENYPNNNEIIIKNNDDKNFNKKIQEIFIKSVDTRKKIPEYEMKVDIIIGFNLPSKHLIDEIIFNINKDTINKYKENEEIFKSKYFENEDEDEEFNEAKNQYEENLITYNQTTQENIAKITIINEIEKKLVEEEKNKFYNLLLSDYLLTFIDKNFKGMTKELINNLKSFVNIILDNKFDLKENNLDLENLSSILNWIDSYSMEIISFINIYKYLSSNKNGANLIKMIIDKIPELSKKYDNLKLSTNIKLINKVFYIIIGSLINLLFYELNQILLEIEDQESLNNLLDNLNNAYYSLLSINNNLNLSMKEIHILHEIITIINVLSFKENEEEIKTNKKLMINFIQNNIIKERPDDDKKEEEYLKNNLNNFYKFYKKRKNINFLDLYSSVLFDEFNKEYNENYRKYLLQTILDDENLFQNNILLIKIIFSKFAEYFKPDKEIDEQVLNYISSEDIYFPLLNDSIKENKKNKEIISKNINKIFDTTINLYFNFLKNSEEHNLGEIITSNLFDIFKEYSVVISDDQYERYYNKYHNENLVKHYVLCFIKIYLNNFVNLLCDNKSTLQGNETDIIDEIITDSPISNTIKLYLIILLYQKTNSQDNFKLNEKIEDCANALKEEIGENDFINILINAKIPNNEKYLFNEFFSYIKYPIIEDFEKKFNSSNDNKEKYPLIYEYINNKYGPKNLKYLIDYNNFINLMISNYSGKISRNEAYKEERHLNSEYKHNDNDLETKFDKFKPIYNEHLSSYVKEFNDEVLRSTKFLDKFEDTDRLAYFLNDNLDKGYGIFIAEGLKKFIEWQNSFLKPIIKSYKEKENSCLSCYVSEMEKEVNIQDANNLQILQIENCFNNTYFINFSELVSLYSERINANINDFIYDYEKIEKEIGKCLLINKCLFNEKNINYVCYHNEGFRNINFNYFIEFEKKYGAKELTEDERKKLFNYANKNFNNFDILFDSFIILINYLNNINSVEKDTKVFDFMEHAETKFINFNKYLIYYFGNEGKEIVIEKLLSSFLYMEHLCYDLLKEKINDKFIAPFNEGEKNEIKEYFNSKHVDAIITKKEIASAIRRFIIRYLLNEEKKENIDPNLSLYVCLERKYLWNNKIFSSIRYNFNDLIKKYLGSFSFDLQARHSLELYNFIGEEEKNFIIEEKELFAEKATKFKEKIKVEDKKNS